MTDTASTIDTEFTDHRKAMRELDFQIRSNRPIISLCTYEETRVIAEAIKPICQRGKKPWAVFQWDIASGLSCDPAHAKHLPHPPNIDKNKPLPTSVYANQQKVLHWFDSLDIPDAGYALLILKDFHKHLTLKDDAQQADLETLRLLRNMGQSFISRNKCVIIISPSITVPDDISKLTTVIDWPLPEPFHIRDTLNKMLQKARENKGLTEAGFVSSYTDGELDEIVRAYQGLTLTEIQLLTTYMMISDHKRLDPNVIATAKREVIRKSGILEWKDVDVSMDSVGGLHTLKRWLKDRTYAFTQEARDYGLPGYPKGIMLIGVQGAGKSLFAEAVAAFWRMPLLMLDMGTIYKGLVGSSEANIRSVTKLAEAVAPCILMLDEVDKGMSGSGSSNITDGGTSARVLGTFLTWMQKKSKPVFVVATANDVSQLPPELMRKGRFDEIFFVDLPVAEDRADIFRIHLQNCKRDPAKFDISKLVSVSEAFTGAEIEACIISAMYTAFADNKREVTTSDIVRAIQSTVPLAVTMKERIGELREWASQRAVNASQNDDRATKKEVSSAPKRQPKSIDIGEDEEL